MPTWKAESSDQTEALILRAGEAISDHDGPFDSAVDPAVEDLRHAGEPIRRLRKSDRSHLQSNLLKTSPPWNSISRAFAMQITKFEGWIIS